MKLYFQNREGNKIYSLLSRSEYKKKCGVGNACNFRLLAGS